MVAGPLAEMLARNSQYVATYQAPSTMPQMASQMEAGVVILICSDPRLNPYQILGIDPTLSAKVTMVRNAGGRVFDAIRTLAVLQTLASPGTIVIMHHTDCGLMHYHDADIRKALVEIAPGMTDSIESSKFGEIKGPIEDSVKEDVALLKSSPLIKQDTQIVGLKYDISSGQVSVVESSDSRL